MPSLLGFKPSSDDWIARSVGDIQASEKWYREVLALPHLYTYGTLAFFTLVGTGAYFSGSITEEARPCDIDRSSVV